MITVFLSGNGIDLHYFKIIKASSLTPLITEWLMLLYK